MMNKLEEIRSASFIGAGNLATHLAQALYSSGIKIVQVYSRSLQSASDLSKKIKSEAICDLSKINFNADLYIFAVTDGVIADLYDSLDWHNKMIVHTAGSIPLQVFKNQANTGVFYPLQTFSKHRLVYFKQIPICIEANEQETENKLVHLAQKISTNVQIIDSEQRKQIHLAAVFACNFSNHMYAIANEILAKKRIDFEIIRPLILETTQKALENDPVSVQTGPALRSDKAVEENHQEMLVDSSIFQKIYRFVSQSIFILNQNK